MGSGFIYLIIIAMWAAYFLPQWLSKHEDTSGKAIERYKNAMLMKIKKKKRLNLLKTFNNFERSSAT